MAYPQSNVMNPQLTVSDSLRFERRCADRHPASGRVTSILTAGSLSQPHQRKIASVELVNLSRTGVCVLASEAVDLQTIMTLCFPPHGAERGFNATGRVVRCIRRDDQTHELGICFKTRPAA
jgi:hypothetical protein